jgi:2'-5' RNA ligase
MNRDENDSGKSRLFFGFEITAPPKLKLPPARHLHEKDRHITFAFLGDVDLNALLEHLQRFPAPEFGLGLVGEFSEVAFFPSHHPHAVVWKVQFHHKERAVRTFHHDLNKWLKVIGFRPVDPEREWVPHVTMGRQRFEQSKWREHFMPLPFVATKFHLYESVGDLKYEPRWSYVLESPFEDSEEGLKVRGKTLQEILLHAQVGLSLKFPELWEYCQEASVLRHYRDLLTHLNKSIQGARGKFELPIHSVHAEEGVMEVGALLEWSFKICLK